MALPAGFVDSDVGLMIEPLLAHSPVDTRTARVAKEDIGDELPQQDLVPWALHTRSARCGCGLLHRTICTIRDFMPRTVAGSGHRNRAGYTTRPCQGRHGPVGGSL